MDLANAMDPHDLSEVGWGVVFARDERTDVIEALQPLLTRRWEEAGKRYRKTIYLPGETARRFLWLRHGESPGTIDPDILPYYLLIVGSPEDISFDFQYQLSVNHAVGRIAFDNSSDYRRYADAVLRAENREIPLPQQVSIFSATSTDHAPASLGREFIGFAGWEVELWEGERASKRNLGRLLGGDATPNLLLVFGEGLQARRGSPDQEMRQGAVICRDWPHKGTVLTPLHVFGATDLAEELAGLQGLVVYILSDFSAGTPFEHTYPHEPSEGVAVAVGSPPRPQVLAGRSFVARLPQALMAHGTLAIVGRVDRRWSMSFKRDSGEASLTALGALKTSLAQLLAGERIGHSLRPLIQRSTAFASNLAESIERSRQGLKTDEQLTASERTADNDARNIVLLGDPAVYLRGVRAPTYTLQVTLDSASLRRAREQAAVEGLDIDNFIGRLLSRRPGARESTSATRPPRKARIPLRAPARPRVFLSYAYENRVLANRIRNGLIERNIDVWIDTDPVAGIPVGANIDQELRRKVEESDFAILCLSTQSVSKRGTVQKEWRWALDHQARWPIGQVFVIPVKLDGCASPQWQSNLGLRHLALRRDSKGRKQDLDNLARQMLHLSGQSTRSKGKERR